MQAGSSQGKASKEPKEIAALPQGMEKQVVVKPLKLQTEKEHRPRISKAKCGHLPKNALKTAIFFHFFSFFALSSHVDTPTKPNFSDTFGIEHDMH